MKRVLNKSMVLALGIVLSFAATAQAWSYSSYSHGSYVPKEGSSTKVNYSDYFTTNVGFTLDRDNVTNILDYNNGGDNPGSDADNKNAYLTLDQTAKPENTLDLEIDASSIVSNLPDPKYDLEINYVGVDCDESEVVALGAVSAKSYYMRTAWNDYRDGGSSDGGKILSQFAMSTKGLSDYNNVVQSDVVQDTTSYGDFLGQP